MSKPEDIICPVCGYYCLGKGGHGCIDKPNIYATLPDTQEQEWRDIEGIAHEIWTSTQLMPGEGIIDGVGRIVEILGRKENTCK